MSCLNCIYNIGCKNNDSFSIQGITDKGIEEWKERVRKNFKDTLGKNIKSYPLIFLVHMEQESWRAKLCFEPNLIFLDRLNLSFKKI